jgi:hypothetical protein
MWLFIFLILCSPVFADSTVKVDNETVRILKQEDITAEQWSKDRGELVLQSERLETEITRLQSKIDEGDARFSDNGIDFEKVVSDKRAALNP